MKIVNFNDCRSIEYFVGTVIPPYRCPFNAVAARSKKDPDSPARADVIRITGGRRLAFSCNSVDRRAIQTHPKNSSAGGLSPRGLACREIGGGQTRDQKRRSRKQVCYQIHGADSEDQIREQTAYENCHACSDNYAASGKQQRTLKHHPKDHRRRGTQSDPDTNFVPLRLKVI
jgi:hypothetical protein